MHPMESLMKTSFWTVVALAPSLTACMTDPVEDVSVSESALASCPKWGCGENTPEVPPFPFHELNVYKIPNQEGIVLDGFVKGGVVYNPRIENGTQLVAYHPSNQFIKLTGTALEGGYLRLLLPNSTKYAVKVSKVRLASAADAVSYWVGPPTTMETYELDYQGIAGTKDSGPLCKNPPTRDEGPGRAWEAPAEAILFTGDRYDVDAKTVTAIGNNRYTHGWFNIACAGSVLAKLHLNRHTTPGSTAPYTTTLSDRQAMLKMYAGDFCGSGWPYTQAGTPLEFTNSYGWLPILAPVQSHEAVWTASGAACLDSHRLGPDWKHEVLQHCSLPACSPAPASYYLSSWVPMPQP